jgi:transcriptional regulator
MVGTMEAGRPQAWQVDEMGPRLERLARGIIAFEAEVLAVEARFKLGQDERDDVFAEILSGLERSGDDALATWMRRFQRGQIY